LTEARGSAATRKRRATVLRRIAYPETLPITARREEIVAAIRAHPVVVVAGETGSGKTTQLPKMCLEAGFGLRARIGCTQPRRVAALSISRRLAEELEVGWGSEVGCKIRFADDTRPETSVKVMTDGILLAELQGDPMLAEYEALILDEAHERSLNIDFLLGYLKQLLRQRDDLKLVITSATIDTALFSRAFDGAPVVEVSGRLYPVEVRYAPLDERAEETGEVTYIDAAVDAVREVLSESAAGDVLVFLPGERDIREACDRLEARHGDRVEVVPLFGRLSAGEQQRVFAPGPRRRVVVATNIAETSLTVPRIRYVVDTGLARVSRYRAATRTHRLPVEPIAQSSANQRKGRCGRVADGVCVRLYSAEDYAARRPFTEPEIQRCDLAEVILRMKAWQLGEVETFPFLEAPTGAAIAAAYQLLEEIGALDGQRGLTALGQELARLPVDPAIGRMLLQARLEGALPEVLVIAAGLSIQDPRERPFDQQAEAEIAHRRFQDPRSDFLTLLNLWEAYHDQWEVLKTQNQMRKFCHHHFLSFLRMREWRDVHAELEEAVAELGRDADGRRWEAGWKPAPPRRGRNLTPPELRSQTPPEAEPSGGAKRDTVRGPASGFDPRYAAIHRAVLTGLWGHVGRRQERNVYRVASGRSVKVFPGSALFLKPSAKPGVKSAADLPAPAAPGLRAHSPEWVVAGELVETTQSYARTVAAIDPEWAIELAPHLTRVTHDQVRWAREVWRVLARERVLLRGLVLRERTVGYGRVNPAEATEVFIRAALVGGELEAEAEAEGAGRRSVPASGQFPFLAHNHRLREKIELWQTRLSRRVVPDLDEAFYRFYGSRLTDVSSVADLDRERKAQGGWGFLCATEREVLGEAVAGFNGDAFPDEIEVGDHRLAVAYAYAPGEERDGVTLRLMVPVAERVDVGQLDWAVPALREERVAHLLRGLPKALRRPLMPLNETARVIACEVSPGGRDYLEAMSLFVRRRYGVKVEVSDWPLGVLPAHLRPRFELVATDGQTLAVGRDLAELKAKVRHHQTEAEAEAWQAAVLRWERYGIERWELGDLPETVLVSELGGFALRAFPALHVEEGAVHLRLFRHADQAGAAMRAAVPRLAQRVMQRELAWLERDLRPLRQQGVLYASLGSGDELVSTAVDHLRIQLLPEPEPPPRTTAGFAAYVDAARARLPGLAARLAERVVLILQRRQEVLGRHGALAWLEVEVNNLVPRRFLVMTPGDRLAHIPRYLQALRVRAERASLNPAKDAEKSERVRPYVERLAQRASAAVPSRQGRAMWHRLRWLIEEYKVAVFAPELGTDEKVSPKVLDQALGALDAACGTAGPRG
jgi:ATP-dependent helicase HrpA